MKPLSQEEMNIYSNLILYDYRDENESDLRNNRDFSSYDITSLEACSKNSDKVRYTQEHLNKDLLEYFTYLPKNEVERFTRTVFWLLKEALKNYGNVTIPEFGKLQTYDRPYRIRYNLSTGEKYKVPLMKLRRVLEFTPSPNFKNLVTPRTLRYMRATPTNVEIKEFPCLFTSFAREKRHRRQGQLLLQKGFDECFRFLGYDNAYISAIYNGDL